jgi:hypothetical protein
MYYVYIFITLLLNKNYVFMIWVEQSQGLRTAGVDDRHEQGPKTTNSDT